MVSPTPLAGITMVELGHNVAGPYGGQIFADLGADVIKVENPESGDAARGWPPFDQDGESAVYLSLNRGKLGVTVDFRKPEQVERLRRLILERADVVLQNLRHGVVERFGLDGPTLVAEKPGLVYCNLGAFGNRGPLEKKPGYDPLVQGFAGIMRVTGEAGRPPVRAGISVNDMGSGMWAAIAILSALHERERTGKGGVIDMSLFETAVSWMGIHAACYQASGRVEPPQGSGAPFIVPYQAFATRDGWILIAAANEGLFRKLCDVLDRREWLDDPRFATGADRVANRAVIVPMIEEIVAGGTTAEWETRLDAAGVPNAPIQSIDQVLAHPQTKAMGQLQTAPEGGIPLVGPPVSFDGVRPPLKRRPPRLAEHDVDVFGEESGA